MLYNISLYMPYNINFFITLYRRYSPDKPIGL